MKTAVRLALRPMLLGSVVAVMVWFAAFPTLATAQGSQGQDAVYSSSNGVVGSSSFIDASMFAGTTFCSKIYNVLISTNPPYPSTGAVIDARGLPGTTGASMTCASGTTPWNNGTTFQNKPSTILLPAGTIDIPTTWVLPNNTRLIGEGDGIASSGSTPGTTIQACATSTNNNCSFTGTDMIDLGTSIVCPLVGGIATCNSVSVERLTLDGQGQPINGIVNTNAQTGSRVDHVGLYRILGTGLLVKSNATNSGPYSSITFDTGGYAGLGSTVCAQILSVSGGTHGLHQLRCTSETSDASAAILIDSSNNSLEDIAIAGFHDGILVGSQAPAESNVLVNITGDTKNCNPICSPPINTVHLAPYTTNGKPNVTDISILGATNDGPGTVTIADDLTSTNLTNPTVGIYALGESSSGGYTRFTTSPNAAHWTVGTTAPSSSTCSRGSLYSCTTPASNVNQCANALWVCTPSGSSFIWTPIQ